MSITQLSPRRPYLLRAFYEWLLDNKLAPHLVVDVNVSGVIVPIQFSRHGQILLNIAPIAVANLTLDHDKVQFNASFNGVPCQVVVPMAAILAIYARENGVGTIFEPEVAYEQLSQQYANNAKAPDLTTRTVMSVIHGARMDNAQDSDPENDLSSTLCGAGRPPLHLIK
ncbi:ClpXP protease specificity-enhancing factor [Sodalis endosymbiont of Henestaris halophilus]|uniref:ClpXP protease specificity-enhancing factor n=1 Tax=Sodalis endosymbiont of Henestaris halophilus TaxID=1929246 RepID=UPI000BC0E67E|nr:ClpXP protease specificity-enhancing factor [Sodalis endosymbiont of Henestaris halophilus]SNC59041.1 Stringent starvation protein B [Sodalis endosymbiont of Henestaris halophilus]